MNLISDSNYTALIYIKTYSFATISRIMALILMLWFGIFVNKLISPVFE